MSIVLFGDPHGELNLMYRQASELNASHVIMLGDTGIYSRNPKVLLGNAKRDHHIPDDCQRYLQREVPIPIPTWMIQGNHEDFDLLEKWKAGVDTLDSLTYVPNGETFEIEGTRFGVIGGNHSFKFFAKKAKDLQGKRRRHFVKEHLDFLRDQAFDVLLLHDAPKSDAIPNGCQELTDFILDLNVDIVYHGHLHHAYQTNIGKTKVFGLGRVGSNQEHMRHLRFDLLLISG